ncbi:putative Ig domain-containing protein [Longispora fulva]|uniref:WD40 repeat protein n=1 Tax=Longispora fulva TaxID=619741 RepID=A0A8J7KPW4_9ACTN|nr:putative Ig domain-containing protein [Longispora fulva]MBG6136767.1 hypothetical protein [Longispora fulva]
MLSRTALSRVAFAVTVLSATALLAAFALTPSPAGAVPIAGQTTRVSAATGLPTDREGSSYDGAISEDGTQVAFMSYSHLDPLDSCVGDCNYPDVYLRDSRANRTVLLTRGQLAPPPRVAYPGPQTSTVDQPASLQLTVTSQAGPVTWAADGLPTGLTIDKDTGLISGTPTAPATYDVKVTATDRNSRRGDLTFEWVVRDVPVTVHEHSGLIKVVGYRIADVTNSATGGHPPYRWSATNMPPGLTIDPATGTMSGTPSQVGVTDSVVTATDTTGASGNTTVRWDIVPRLLVIHESRPGPDLGDIRDHAVNPERLRVVSGGEAPFTWTIVGTPPPGITYTPTTGPELELRGTPTTLGTFRFRVDVRSADLGEAHFPLNWTIVGSTVSGETRLRAEAADPEEWRADGESELPSVSGTGRYVAFQTDATNLVREDSDNMNDVVIVDRDPDGDGVFDEPRPGSTAMDYRYLYAGQVRTSEGSRTNATESPSLNADATAVAWRDRTLHGDPDYSRVRITPLVHGENGQLTAGPIEDAAFPALAGMHPVSTGDPAISADGRHVVFAALYCGTSCGATQREILVDHDRVTGTATRIDAGDGGKPLAEGGFGKVAVSRTGQMVAFAYARRVTGEPATQVYVVDRGTPTGGTFPGPATYWLASRDATGAPAAGAEPTLSTDGRYLAFVTDDRGVHNGWDRYLSSERSSCLHTRYTANICQVVARDLIRDRAHVKAGTPVGPAELVSASHTFPCVVPTGGTGTPSRGPTPATPPPPNSTCGGNEHSNAPALSGDGRFVAFGSTADDLAPDDVNGYADVFTREFMPGLKKVDPLVFGTVDVGDKATETATVTVEGFGPLPISKADIAKGPDFTLDPADTCAGTVRHEEDPCLVPVRFTPTAKGERTGTVTVTGGRAPVKGLLDIGLVGGTGPARHNAIAQPDPVAFGDRLLITPSGPATVTVTNQGTRDPEKIGAVALDGQFAADYAITRNLCQDVVLAPGASCTVALTHAPHGVGQRPGSLRIVHGPLDTPLLVGLTGGGKAPTLRANPAVVRPGGTTSVQGTNFPASRPVTVVLAGLAPVTVTADADGNLATTYLVLPKTPALPRTLAAVIPGVSDPVAFTVPGLATPVTAPLLVEAGTLQESDFHRRR